MKATCKSDPTHDKFVTTAHVMEEWLVDQHGDWIETLESVETTSKPDPGNLWTCHVCGSDATVE